MEANETQTMSAARSNNSGQECHRNKIREKRIGRRVHASHGKQASKHLDLAINRTVGIMLLNFSLRYFNPSEVGAEAESMVNLY